MVYKIELIMGLCVDFLLRFA